MKKVIGDLSHFLYSYVRSNPPELTIRQMTILLMIAEDPAMNEVSAVSYIAEKLNLTKAVITRSTAALLKYRFIEKRISPKDGRLVHLWISDTGKLFLDNLEKHYNLLK